MQVVRKKKHAFVISEVSCRMFFLKYQIFILTLKLKISSEQGNKIQNSNPSMR